MMGVGVHAFVGQGLCGKSLYLPLKFSVGDGPDRAKVGATVSRDGAGRGGIF